MASLRGRGILSRRLEPRLESDWVISSVPACWEVAPVRLGQRPFPVLM